MMLFILNFIFYCAETSLNLSQYWIEPRILGDIKMVSWFGFGSFLFLFVFYAAYPTQITRKYRFINLILLFPLLEYLNNVLRYLYTVNVLTEDTALFEASVFLLDIQGDYSFPYFLISLVVSIAIIAYERLFSSFHLIHQIPIRWLTGTFVMIILLVVSYEIFSDTIILFYTLILIFSVYFLLFIFQHPLVFSDQRVDFTNQLKKIFTDKVPTILLDKNDLIIHINQHALQILKQKKIKYLASRLIPSFHCMLKNIPILLKVKL